MKLAFNLFFYVGLVGGSRQPSISILIFIKLLNSIDTQKQGNKEKPYQLKKLPFIYVYNL